MRRPATYRAPEPASARATRVVAAMAAAVILCGAAEANAQSKSPPPPPPPAQAQPLPPPPAPPPGAAGQQGAQPPPGYPPPGYPPPGYPPPGYAPPGYPPPEGYPPPPPGYPPPPPGYYYGPPPGYVPPGPQQPRTLEEYERQIEATEAELKEAKDRGAAREVKEHKARLNELKKGYNELRDREMPRRSTGMMVGGIVLLSVGGAGIIAGAVLGLSATTSSRSGDDYTVPAIVAVTGGVLCAGAGIPLLYIGSKRERKTPDPNATATTVLLYPGGAGLRMQF
jgi:hypothetical protein